MRKSLVAFITALISLAGVNGAAGWDSIADWPVRGAWLRLPVIPDPNWLPGHRGLDLAAAVGGPIRSPVSGLVVWVGEVNLVPGITIVDRLGLRHSLQPVTAAVEEGQEVLRGEVIGWLAAGQHCRVSCLHWGVRQGRQYLDPRWLLPPTIRRLPAYARG